MTAGNVPTGAFVSGAREMAACGLAVLPLGGDDGKKPLVSGWGQWKRRPGVEFIEKLAAKNPTANVGIICGLSGVTVLDIDDPEITDDLIRKCGDTPLKVQTPSGGLHLYYRYDAEPCANLRKQGFDADVKARGGIVTAPPSVRPGTHCSYRFIEGGWSDLDKLPWFRRPATPLLHKELPVEVTGVSKTLVTTGQRNNALFKAVLRGAHNCTTMDDALMLARKANKGFSPPLSDSEVVRTAQSAWKVQLKGQNWCRQEAHVSLPISLWSAFDEKPDALSLFGHLLAAHGGRRESFAISPKAMTSADTIRGWDRRRYERNRDWLLERGFLTRLYKGGRKPGDRSLYSFGPRYSKGDNFCPQYN